MKIIFNLLMVSLLFASAKKVVAQPGVQVPCKWDITLNYDSATNFYTVYGKPDTSFSGVNGWPMATAQITVLLPDSLPNVPLNIISHNFGGWVDQDKCYGGPLNTSGFDYHAIFTIGQNVNIYKDSAMKWFSFQIPQKCRNFVRLLRDYPENYTFPLGTAVIPADQPYQCGPFNNFANSIGNGSVLLQESYNMNYDNYGWHCGVPPLAPLSSSLKSIDAISDDCNAIITWETLSEKDVKGYAVMVSKDGNNYTEIGYLDAKGVSSKYSFEHVNANTGANYYKIVTKNEDGTYEYSNYVKLTVYCNGAHVAYAFPNPANSSIDLVINTGSQDENTKLKAQVMDMLGNVVLENTEKIFNRKVTIHFNTASLANGNYMIRYQNDVKAYSGVVKFTKISK
jgi:Secretion system C-terminal sorting domain